jgi:hypothetical protein
MATSFVTYVIAFNLSQSTTIYVNATDPAIELYWNAGCTDPVTSIDFGNLQKGAYEEVLIYVKNAGGGDVKIYWNSTLSDVTTEISDWWGLYLGRSHFGNSDINGVYMSSGQVLGTYYKVLLDPEATLGSYSWTLNIGSWQP